MSLFAPAVVNFALTREYIELHHLLQVTGVCSSGAQAKILVAEGQVFVDGVLETRKRAKVRQGQVVQHEDTTIVLTHEIADEVLA
jgi:ribosome-associated protein